MLASLASLWRYRDLVRGLVQRDLRLRYKGSTLGFAWSLLNPLLMAAVYTVAFKFIIRIQIDRFPLFLLSGLLPWMFFSTALLQATGSIADNGALVRKVAFPRLALPAGAVVSQFVQFLLMYVVIVPVALGLGSDITPALVALVPIAALHLVFTAGLALVAATAYVYFRDTRHLLEVGLQVWFWVTPIVYAVTLVPVDYRRWFALNPMAHFVGAYQHVVLDQQWPDVVAFGAMGLAAGVAFLVGLAVFARHERRFAELI